MKKGRHFLEISVEVRVLKKRHADDYHGRWIDGHKSTGWALCPRSAEVQKLYFSDRVKNLISKFSEEYGLLPDDPKEEIGVSYDD